MNLKKAQGLEEIANIRKVLIDMERFCSEGKLDEALACPHKGWVTPMHCCEDCDEPMTEEMVRGWIASAREGLNNFEKTGRRFDFTPPEWEQKNETLAKN